MPAGVSDQRGWEGEGGGGKKEGDKNTNDCDLLLIVYHREEKEVEGGGGGGTERNPLQIELSLFEPGLLQKRKISITKKYLYIYTNSMTEATNDNSTTMHSDPSRRLVTELAGRY